MNGPCYMLLSAFGFALMGAFVKEAGEAGVPLLQVVFMRAVFCVVLSFMDIARAKVHPLGNQRWLLITRGVVGFFALTCVFYSVLNLPFIQATILQYLHPVFTALLAWIFLRETPTKGTLIGVVLSLAGLVAIMLPMLAGGIGTDFDYSANFNWLAVIAGLGGAFGSGAAYTIVRKLAATEHPSVIALYFPVVCILATLLFGTDSFIWLEPAVYLVLLGVGVFGQLGQIALTKAMQTDTASRATSFSYMQIVFAAFLGVLFFGEIPSGYTLLGGALILFGAVINTLMKPIVNVKSVCKLGSSPL